MIEEPALVTAITEKHIHLQAIQSSACQQCSEKNQCSTALYAKMLPKRDLALPCSFDVEIGDNVMVGIEESHFLRVTFFMYILPLLFMLISTAFATQFSINSFLAACLGLCSGLVFVHQLQKNHFHLLKSSPKILRKLE